MLDGQDNTEWLSDSDEEFAGQANDNQNSSSPVDSGGDNDALSPPSSNHTDTNSSSHGGALMLEDRSGSQQPCSPYTGEAGINAFRDDEEVGDNVTLAQATQLKKRPTRRPPQSSENYDDHPVIHQLGELGVGGQGWSTQPYPPYPMYPQVPQGHQPSYYPPPVYFNPPPVAYPPTAQYSYGAYGIFGPVIPYGYVQRPETSSGSGGNSMDTRIGSSNNCSIGQPLQQAYDDNDDDDVTGRYHEPPRHSFWV